MHVSIGPFRRWCERRGFPSLRDGSLESRFAKGVFWSVGGAIGAQGLSMIAPFVTARLLGKVGVGEVGIVTRALDAFGIFAGLNATPAASALTLLLLIDAEVRDLVVRFLHVAVLGICRRPGVARLDES